MVLAILDVARSINARVENGGEGDDGENAVRAGFKGDGAL